MKTTITLSTLFVFWLCTAFSPVTAFRSEENPSVGKASVVSTFDFFRTHRQGRAGITATWGISGPGNDVSGFLVERTYEDPADPYANWEIVSAMQNAGARSMKCTDTNIFPGFISYRVTALLFSGGAYVSPVSTVHIVSH
jgi:hypothetical protein